MQDDFSVVPFFQKKRKIIRLDSRNSLYSLKRRSRSVPERKSSSITGSLPKINSQAYLRRRFRKRDGQNNRTSYSACPCVFAFLPFCNVGLTVFSSSAPSSGRFYALTSIWQHQTSSCAGVSTGRGASLDGRRGHPLPDASLMSSVERAKMLVFCPIFRLIFFQKPQHLVSKSHYFFFSPQYVIIITVSTVFPLSHKSSVTSPPSLNTGKFRPIRFSGYSDSSFL